MELWIRSQNKKEIVKVDQIYVDENRVEANFKRYYGGCNYVILGTYTDDTRALEVLDEIYNLLQPTKFVIDSRNLKPDGDSWVENGVIIQKYNAEAKVEELSTCVYQMPREW